MIRTSLLLGCLCLSACGGTSNLPLTRVVLHQNGIGYFERRGTVDTDVLSLRFASHELDDVLGTLAVLDAAGGETVASASVPARVAGEESAIVDLRLPDRRRRELLVSYAIPVPAWRAVYRVVLPPDGAGEAVFQIWALIHNASPESWDGVALELATNAPFSFAVDLRTPAFVPRPDVTGRLVTPVLSGAVLAERTELETAVSPSADSDGDRIRDVDDSCPFDPETYNGMEDEDGCPDRGSVIVSDAAIFILEKIYFQSRSAVLSDAQSGILDSLAATLTGNPQLTAIRIDGHAAADEPNGWGISAERAGAVRAALITRGVDPSRLVAEPFGATLPIDPGSSAEAYERNRRVEFTILSTSDGLVASGATVSPAAVGGSSAPSAEVRTSGGTTHFALGGAVSVPASSSTLVTLSSTSVEGRRVLLFRPDDAAAESASHPFVAAQVRTPSDITLIPGAVTIYAGGAFVGEGLIEHGEPGELATIPYAIDRTTRVESRSREVLEPVRIVSADGAALRIEDRTVVETTYTITTGAGAPLAMVLHHVRRSGTEPQRLPPEAEILARELVLGLPLTLGASSTLVVEETRTHTRSLSLTAELGRSLTPYLEGTALDAATRARLEQIVAARTTLAQREEALHALRQRLADAASRTAELRANVAAVTAPALRRTLSDRLREAAVVSEGLSAEVATASAEVAELRVSLSESLLGLHLPGLNIETPEP